MFDVSRRSFLVGAAAGVGTRLFSATNLGEARVRLGVLSDIHIQNESQIPIFEKALTFFRDRGADGVIVAGDMANTGLTDQLELVAKSWSKIFPGNKAPDGRTVERLFVYGNHDVSDFAADYLARRYKDPKERAAHQNKTDPKGCWERIFQEPWQGVFAKNVKGYVFIGAHWGHEHELAAFLAANADKLGLHGRKPFFYAQHPHPGNTVQGPWAWGHDGGVATRALSAFPNAVAFSGHSHYSHTDERCVWQGAFTSIGTSSLSYIFAQYCRENGEDYGNRPLQMPCLNESAGRQGLLVSVYDDSLVLERREFETGEKTGPDWVIPLDGSRPFAFDVRAASRVAPEFASDVRVTVSRARGKDRRGNETDQITVAFPPACPSKTSRVYDYEVRACAYDEDVEHELAVRRVLSTSFHLPPTQETKDQQICVFAASDLPARGPIRFIVRPTECYGRKGREIVSDLWYPEATLADAVPAWAEREIAATVSRYRAWKGTDETIAFTVITDVHSKLQTLSHPVDWGNSLAHQILAQRAAAVADCDFLADLGDHDFQYCGKTQQEMEARVRTTRELYSPCRRPVLFALGNHDHGDGKTHVLTSARFGDALNGLMLEHGCAFHPGANKSWGYLDLPAKKTRVFVLNTSDEGYYGYSKAQLQFLADNLRLAEGWTAVVCQHFCIQTKIGFWLQYRGTTCDRGDVAIRMFEDLVAGKAGSADGVTWDFTSNRNVRFAGCFFGDSHYDNHVCEKGVNYTITQGYGGIGKQDLPTDNGAHVEPGFDRSKQMLVDLVAFKPHVHELRIFRIGAGGAARDRGYSY